MVRDLPAAAREALFWRNAARFYRIAVDEAPGGRIGRI
jgi:hypothetical protein